MKVLIVTVLDISNLKVQIVISNICDITKSRNTSCVQHGVIVGPLWINSFAYCWTFQCMEWAYKLECWRDFEMSLKCIGALLDMIVEQKLRIADSWIWNKCSKPGLMFKVFPKFLFHQFWRQKEFYKAATFGYVLSGSMWAWCILHFHILRLVINNFRVVSSVCWARVCTEEKASISSRRTFMSTEGVC